jgi:arylsulfatase A-like enzyme
MEKVLGQRFTRKRFLQTAGAGAGLALLGGAGCSTNVLPNLPQMIRKLRGENANVVLVILDSLRKDHVGAYGNDWIQTPNLDALAKESLRFTRPYPESAPTILARRAIHTGMRVFPFRDRQRFKGINIALWGWQPIPRKQTTLAEILKENGYQTMLVTDTLHQFKASMNFQRGFDVFEYIRGQTTDPYRPLGMAQSEMLQKALLKDTSPGELEGSNVYFQQYFANTSYRKTEEDWFAPQVFGRASELLEAAKEGQPFFLVADSYDPHPPWDPPEEYVSLYDEGYEGQEPFTPLSGPSDYLTDRQLQRMKALYAAEITMTDRWLGRFMDKMEELKLFENTLLMVISDHGVAFGEHGITGKLPNQLWPEITDIMFLARHPEGAGAGKTSNYFASTHDVAPTILSYLGIEPPEPMDGEDLSVILGGGSPEERSHFSLGYHNYVWARDETYAFFSRNDGTEARLYNVQEDPEMRNDIASQNQAVLNKMFGEYILEDAGGPLPKYGA